MDITPRGLIRNWVPNLPNVVSTAALSVVGRSLNSKHQDTLTETIVASARPILQTPASLLKSQQNCNTDWGVGRPWISKYTVSKPPEDAIDTELEQSLPATLNVRRAVQYGIQVLARSQHDTAKSSCHIPDLIDVETEWTFYRPHVLPISPIPDVSEQQIYAKYMQDVDPDGPTILHLHGGAYCLMDPSTHRWTLSSLCQKSGGRALSVRYRLSPQNMFPAALLDALQAYLSLIAPPPKSYHSPVAPSKIVLSGDSSGGGLASSLLLLLLTLSRQNIHIQFHGQSVAIPSPPCAGLALASPWLDITRSLPSTAQNSRYDIIAAPPLDAATPPFPPDAIWPASPPRAETFITADMVNHPLVSPLAALPHEWIGAPPVYVSCGWEGVTDEVEVFARRVYQSSPQASVIFEGWEGMPHCFMMVPWNRAGRDALTNWGRFCRTVATDSNLVKRQSIGKWTNSLSHQSRKINLDDLGLMEVGSGYSRKRPLTDAYVESLMDKAAYWRRDLEQRMVHAWRQELAQKLPN